MQIKNLEVGLRRMMVTAFRSKGLTAAAAEAKATRHMAAAKAHFDAKRATPVSAIGRDQALSNIKVSRAKILSNARAANQLALAENAHAASGQFVGFGLLSVARWAKSLP